MTAGEAPYTKDLISYDLRNAPHSERLLDKSLSANKGTMRTKSGGLYAEGLRVRIRRPPLS